MPAKIPSMMQGYHILAYSLNRQHMSEKSQRTSQNNGSILWKKNDVIASSSLSCIEEIISEIDRKHAENVVSSSEIGSPKFILWAIFRNELHRPSQCLVAFGDCNWPFPALLVCCIAIRALEGIFLYKNIYFSLIS